MQKFDNVVAYTEWLEKQTGTKEIRLRNFFKVTKVTVQPVKNRNGNWLGVKDPALVSREEKESGQYIPTPDSKRVLEEGVTFDLDNEKDRKDWAWVKYSRCIVMNKLDALSNRDAVFYVETPEYEAQVNISNFEYKFKAMEMIKAMPEDRYVDLIRMLGENRGHTTRNQMKEYLYNFANKNTEKAKLIISKLEDPDYFILALIERALEARYITTDGRGSYYYGEAPLGFSKGAVKDFLKDVKNTTLKNEISARVGFDASGIDTSIPVKKKMTRKPTNK